MEYNTEQKTLVEAWFARNPESTFTAQEVSSALPLVGRSTVYRVISHLVEEGRLRKAGEKGRTVLYQYSPEGRCGRHMHLSCSICGRTEHLDEGITEAIERMIESSSGFTALPSTVFQCICSDCRKVVSL